MNIQQILALVSVSQQLIAVGSATVTQIKAFFQTLHPGLTDSDLNAILDTAISGAGRRKALADADIAAAAAAAATQP